ncbi:carcinine hydrolase/isopenicillin-N N-acyltransferase family protein [Microlunatus sp. Gsoil 973]|jgi:predicted choloylglycine hydrolase|uniref:carcinine hydrolase/isopenicillin-N N-acyltransferase family protein n=1 Tax=Microlunatus sp. Gsoil 973 TaxID=2672569 RepID=UPI001E4BDC19|nr:carcinine hydrolase/isopenicillin-N N-acyltransferase family protein [Microlunatus sp. Gsoil 973]
MPGLAPILTDQPDGPGAQTFLTHAALRPFSPACTQIGSNGTLVRNYDFPPDQCEGTIVSTCFLSPVIGIQDPLWGLLDGMNDAGLAISLTFGGRSV